MGRTKRPESRSERTVIRVESGPGVVVPHEAARSYYLDEIANEGRLRGGCHPVIQLPRSECGEATRPWMDRVFLDMERSRRENSAPRYTPPGGAGRGEGIDIGLIDVRVTFRGPLGFLTSQLRLQPMGFFDANARELDRVCGGMLHDQMTLATALHATEPDGTTSLHFHNVVFGLRKEVRGGTTLVAPLDFAPLLGELGGRLDLCLVSAVSLR